MWAILYLAGSMLTGGYLVYELNDYIDHRRATRLRQQYVLMAASRRAALTAEGERDTHTGCDG